MNQVRDRVRKEKRRKEGRKDARRNVCRNSETASPSSSGSSKAHWSHAFPKDWRVCSVGLMNVFGRPGGKVVCERRKRMYAFMKAGIVVFYSSRRSSNQFHEYPVKR